MTVTFLEMLWSPPSLLARRPSAARDRSAVRADVTGDLGAKQVGLAAGRCRCAGVVAAHLAAIKGIEV